MKKFIHINIILSLIGSYFLSPSHAQSNHHKIEKQLKDFHLLKTALLENEAGLYLYNDSNEIENKFSDIQNQLQSPKTDLELYRIFSSLISEIKCGHTQVFPSRKIMSDFFGHASTLPFDVKFVSGKLYALKNFGKAPKISKNDEIIKINNQSITELIEKMYPFISSDGNNTTFKDKQLGQYFLMYYFFSQYIPQTFDLEFVNKDRDTLQIAIQPVFPDIKEYKEKDKQSKKKLEKEEQFGTLKVMKSANYALLTLPGFEKSSGRKYKKFVDESFEKINKNGIENLIIDLRDNFGGKNQYYLTSYLAHSELEYGYFKTKGTGKPSYNQHIKKLNKDYILCRLALYKNKKAIKNNTPIPTLKNSVMRRPEAFNGRIYVLINGNSFSAASNLASNLKEKSNAIIIGEESGGGYKQGNSGRLRLLLPSLEFTVIINPIYFNNAPINTSQKEDGVIPHYYVKENYPAKKNSDPYIKQALKLIIETPELPEIKPGKNVE